MRFSIHLPLAVAVTLVLPTTAFARSSAGFVRVGAPAPEEEADPAEPDPEEEAMTLFRAGQIAYRNQDFRRALEFFQDAQSRHPSPIFHFNIGLCYEALEKPEQAIDAYRAYLRSGPEDRSEIEGKITKLEEKLAEKKRKAAEAKAAPTEAPATAEAGPEAETGTADPTTPTDAPADTKPGRALIITGAALTAVGAAVAGGSVGPVTASF